ncbi:MAG: hypothetical protein ACOCVH_01225 [Verrucomicrobiota bacterium]
MDIKKHVKTTLKGVALASLAAGIGIGTCGCRTGKSSCGKGSCGNGSCGDKHGEAKSSCGNGSCSGK